MQKRLITAADIREASLSGKKSINISSGQCIVTPMAKDEAEALNVAILCNPATSTPPCDCPALSSPHTLEGLVKTVSDLIQARNASSVPGHELEAIVREVVSTKLELGVDQPSSAAASQAINHQGIRIINALIEPVSQEGQLSVPQNVWVANTIGGQAGEKLTGGLMVWEKSTFKRCVESPEIAIVIDGELHLIIDGDTIIGKPGDMIYFPQGATVDFHAPAKVKLACVNCVN